VPGEADLQVRTRTGREIEIGPLRTTEVERLFALFAEIVESGDGFPQAPPLTREVFEATWMRSTSAVIAARTGGDTSELLGAYYLKPNFAPRAGHIANAGYAVAREGRGAGIGRALIEDSIARAPHHGFRAIQFNLVFASNPARRLYEELGWIEIGRIPDAVDGDEAIIYWRSVATG
jgi:GNAT superfamily N-acetyltransferase